MERQASTGAVSGAGQELAGRILRFASDDITNAAELLVVKTSGQGDAMFQPIRSSGFLAAESYNELVRAIRMNLGNRTEPCTQRELAKVVGATERSVGRWERRESKPLSHQKGILALLAAHLGIWFHCEAETASEQGKCRDEAAKKGNLVQVLQRAEALRLKYGHAPVIMKEWGQPALHHPIIVETKRLVKNRQFATVAVFARNLVQYHISTEFTALETGYLHLWFGYSLKETGFPEDAIFTYQRGLKLLHDSKEDSEEAALLRAKLWNNVCTAAIACAKREQAGGRAAAAGTIDYLGQARAAIARSLSAMPNFRSALLNGVVCACVGADKHDVARAVAHFKSAYKELDVPGSEPAQALLREPDVKYLLNNPDLFARLLPNLSRTYAHNNSGDDQQ